MPPSRERILNSLANDSDCQRLGVGSCATVVFGPRRCLSPESTVEEGERLATVYWHLAGAVPPQHFRLAVFSYTVLEAQLEDVSVRSELAMLDREIRAAVFSTRVGILPA